MINKLDLTTFNSSHPVRILKGLSIIKSEMYLKDITSDTNKRSSRFKIQKYVEPLLP